MDQTLPRVRQEEPAHVLFALVRQAKHSAVVWCNHAVAWSPAYIQGFGFHGHIREGYQGEVFLQLVI